MEDLVIRPARPDDVTALVALDTYAAAGNARASAIRDWVEAQLCVCAEIAGQPVGYAAMHRHFFGQPMLELVMVAQNHRRQGIGRALIRHAIASAAGSMLWTSTNQSNLPMQALLAEMGFQRSGIVEGLDDGDPELIYRITRV